MSMWHALSADERRAAIEERYIFGTVTPEQVMILSPQDSLLFAEMLLDPPAPNAKLRAAAAQLADNIFADLGLSNPDDRLAKAQLAIQLRDIIEQRGWTQEQAAEVLRVGPVWLKRLLRGRLFTVSLDDLRSMVERLAG